MKYMGHKGRILDRIRQRIAGLAEDAETLADPFCGSAVVAWDLANSFEKRVIAGDLQRFAVVRARAVLSRTSPITNFDFVCDWFDRAQQVLAEAVGGTLVPRPPSLSFKTKPRSARSSVLEERRFIKEKLVPRFGKLGQHWPMTLAYGGYYFSVHQAMQLDALRQCLPTNAELSDVALSSLIAAASKCSASPGHTAQPLGLNASSLPHVVDARNRSVHDYVLSEATSIGSNYSKVKGCAIEGSWQQCFARLNEGDVAFCDPPYSGVQYSRFYHVLETLSRGLNIIVSGSGRNPPPCDRPISAFSQKGASQAELEALIFNASSRKLRLVITFPVGLQSNGLTSEAFTAAAKRQFERVETQDVRSIFSSLGGNGAGGLRPARRTRVERIICCY